MARRRPTPLLDRLAENPRVAVDRLDTDNAALAASLGDAGLRVTVLSDGSAGLAVPAGCSVARPCAAVAGIDYDVLFVHDYTSPTTALVKDARRAGVLVTQFAEYVVEAAPCPVVGVTGSAGKTTVATLAGEMLAASGSVVHTPRDHYLVDSRNPNAELLAALPTMGSGDRVVVELTSSHLEYMQVGPQVAVVTSITPDHIDWHGTLEAYVAAKARIVQCQQPDDWAVLNEDDPVTVREVMPLAPAAVATFSTRHETNCGAHIAGDTVVARWNGRVEPLASLEHMRSLGLRPDNVLAAAVAALAAGATFDGIRVAIAAFRGLRHRMEAVADEGGIRVVDDGIAFTPRKAAAGLATMADNSVALVCGGRELVAGWSMTPLHAAPEERRLLHEFAATAAVKAVRTFVFGPAAATMREALLGGGCDPSAVAEFEDIDSATAAAVRSATAGMTVLFAPVFVLEDDELEVFARVARRELRNLQL